MKKIICFGDSNTYGYDPRSYFGGRYLPEYRWVDSIARKTEWEVKNLGSNGREIPKGIQGIPEDTDLFLVMLGGNDLLQGNSVDVVKERMKRFLQSISLPMDKILLIAPPVMKRGEWVPSDELVEDAKKMTAAFRTLAEELHVPFADAGEWGVDLAYDGVHFSEKGHQAFAEGLLKVLKELLG